MSVEQQPASARALVLALSASALAFWLGRLSVPNQAVVAPSPGTAQQATIPAQAPLQSWETHWRQLTAQPGTPARDQEIAGLIRRLAATDPTRAVSLALAQANRLSREEFLRAALGGWAADDPEAAGAWAATQSTMDRTQAVALVLGGMVHSPTSAVRLIKHLSQENPALAREYGAQLVSVLSQGGEFNQAVEFATQGAPEYRLDWSASAFARWSLYQPENAATRALELTDPALRREALQAVISGWAQAAPCELAEFATALPAGPERTNALRAALCSWANENPVSAAAWLERLPPSSDLDAGATAVATSMPILGRAGTAVSWARRIVDADLRSSTLATILRDLANREPATARHYAEELEDLHPDDRAAVIAALTLVPAP